LDISSRASSLNRDYLRRINIPPSRLT